jgi:Membrane-associated phospholipid phosphatase
VTARFAAVQRFDHAAQAWVLAHQHPALDRVFLVITTLGGIMAMRVVALTGALYLLHRRRRPVAALVLLVAIVADALFTVAKRFYARPRPAGLGAGVDGSVAFPSGHSTMSAAVCCTLAYVLWREGYLRGGAALGIATVPPLLVGISRVYLNVHWATDVLGGWLAGFVIAALAAALYHRYCRPATALVPSHFTSIHSP